jgi:urea transporter
MWVCFRNNLSRAKGTFVFGIVLVAVQIYSFFAPPPASDKAIAITAILSYIVFALVIWWLQDRKSASHNA